MKTFFILLLTSHFIISCSTKSFSPGKYSIKHAAYGKFATSIELKKDSTFIKNFSGDMMNDNSYGKWCVVKDTLLLSFDTVNYPKSRYTKDECYLIKGKKLFWQNMLIAEFKKKGIWDTLSPKYKKKYCNTTIKP